MHFAESGDTLAQIPHTRDRSERSGWLSQGLAGLLRVRAFSTGASREAPVENIRFGCNPGGRACQQVLRAKHLLKMHVFGCNPGGRACQQVLRAKHLLKMHVLQRLRIVRIVEKHALSTGASREAPVATGTATDQLSDAFRK